MAGWVMFAPVPRKSQARLHAPGRTLKPHDNLSFSPDAGAGTPVSQCRGLGFSHSQDTAASRLLRSDKLSAGYRAVE